MTLHDTTIKAEIGNVIQKIRNLHSDYERAIDIYRYAVNRSEESLDDKKLRSSGQYWVTVAFLNSLIKLRLIVEQNFNYIESLGLLATSRYIFELLVWLRLLKSNSVYGLVYYVDLLRKQKNHYNDLQVHLKKEMSFFNDMDQQEGDLIRDKVAALSEIADEIERNGPSGIAVVR